MKGLFEKPLRLGRRGSFASWVDDDPRLPSTKSQSRNTNYSNSQDVPQQSTTNVRPNECAPHIESSVAHESSVIPKEPTDMTFKSLSEMVSVPSSDRPTVSLKPPLSVSPPLPSSSQGAVANDAPLPSCILNSPKSQNRNRKSKSFTRQTSPTLSTSQSSSFGATGATTPSPTGKPLSRVTYELISPEFRTANIFSVVTSSASPHNASSPDNARTQNITSRVREYGYRWTSIRF